MCLQLGFTRGFSGESLPADAGDVRDAGLSHGSGRDSTEKGRAPTPVFLPGESHGQRSLAVKAT